MIALARCGSMTAAAKSLDTNTATVSRHIHRMTEIYGTVLFVKKKTRWELTKEGEALVRVIEAFEKGLHDLDRNNGLALTSGRTVKIATVDFLCVTHMMPHLGEFVADNPGLGVEFVCSDTRVSLAYGEADVSVRLSRPQEGRLVGRKTAEISLSPYKGAGDHSGDWIGLGEELDWTPEMRMARDLFGRPPILRVQSFDAMRRGASTSGLACVIPDSMATPDLGLTRMMPDQPSVMREIWVIYHETRKMDPVVRLTADWIHRCFEAVDDVPARSVA
ncbi:LysR family transcriptional regulator [Pseudaestuariivita atlantica]|nr:LysR family transcriptional regulator [Pseudaestuariivita atlantica]